MDKFLLVDKARKILGLDEEVTAQEVRDSYLAKIKEYHPDRCKDKTVAEKMSKELNWAYGIIRNYCQNYRFSFKKDNVRRTDLDYQIQKQWEEDWLGH